MFRGHGVLGGLLLSLTTLLLASSAPAAPSRGHVLSACPRPTSSKEAACTALEFATPSSAHASQAAQTAPIGYSPQALHTAYSLPYTTPGVSQTQTIAIIDAYDDPTAESDLATYDQQFGLPACTSDSGCFRKVDEHGGMSYPTGTSWAFEIALDTQLAQAACTDCHILLVEAASTQFSDLEVAVRTAARLGATEISNSYTNLEGAYYTGDDTYDLPGKVITAAAGDCGYEDAACLPPTGSANEEGVNFPASSPDVVAVGATSLTVTPTGWQNTAWGMSGSGCSSFFPAPAWQTTLPDWSSLGCAHHRAVTDVSVVGDPNTGLAVYQGTSENVPGGLNTTGWVIGGGSSAATAVMAGEFALAGGAHGVAHPAQTLYRHAGNGSDFYDVTQGSNANAAPCPNLPDCNAAIGYDAPSGLGTPLGLGAFAVRGAPVSIAPPSIAGSSQLGTVLLARPGVFSNRPKTIRYQWQINTGNGFTDIPGATSPAFLLTDADAGDIIQVEVFASNALGVAVAAALPPALGGLVVVVPQAISRPSIRGRAVVGHLLRATAGRFSGGGASYYSYQWLRARGGHSVLIRGATRSSYRVRRGDARYHLEVLVKATNSAGSAKAASKPSAAVKGH